MKIEEKEIQLKDGRKAVLRSPEEKDAGAYLSYFLTVLSETEYLSCSADEVQANEKKEREYVKGVLASSSSAIACVFLDGEIIADTCVSIPQPEKNRLKHRAYLGIAVKKQFWSQGIGSTLLCVADEIAKKLGASQIELEVNSDNARARALYERFGYREWGRIPHGVKKDDGSGYSEMLTMGKFLRGNDNV